MLLKVLILVVALYVAATEAYYTDDYFTEGEREYCWTYREYWERSLNRNAEVKEGQQRTFECASEPTEYYDDRAVLSDSRLWTGGRVPYTVGSAFDQYQRCVISNALAEIEAVSCVRFVRKEDSDTNYMGVDDRGGSCYGYDGMTGIWPGDERKVNLVRDLGCVTKWVIVHEVMHTLGFHHEQKRPDRDKCVQVLWENIDVKYAYTYYKGLSGDDPCIAKGSCEICYSWPQKQGTDFDGCTSGEIYRTFDLPYDYDSIMHYPDYSYNVGGKNTLTPKSGDICLPFTRFGPVNMYDPDGARLTEQDAERLRRAYKCD